MCLYIHVLTCTHLYAYKGLGTISKYAHACCMHVLYLQIQTYIHTYLPICLQTYMYVNCREKF